MASTMRLLLHVVVVGGLLALAFYFLREVYMRGRLRGIRETMHGISRGVSNQYEHEQKEIPESAAGAMDQMKASVAQATGAVAKCQAYRNYMWQLGNEMGRAAWQHGFEQGQRFTDPRDGETRAAR